MAKEKPKKNFRLQRHSTRDLCKTGEVLYQLSYEAMLLPVWSRPISLFNLSGIDGPNKTDLLPTDVAS